MNTWTGFKKVVKTTRLLPLMMSMIREVTVDSTAPAMSVEVTTDKSSYLPGDEVTVQVLLRDFAPNDHGYSYFNFIVQYDSQVFDNAEYTQQSVYTDANYSPGDEVNNIFQFNFQNPVDGSIYLGMNTTMRGIDIQVEAANKLSCIPAVDQTLVTFKLRVREQTLASSSTISLANEFTRIRTSEAGNSFYLYSPDVTEITPAPVEITRSPSVSVFSSPESTNRLA
ncbi:cohesin domain-containing protein [Paenibacillus sp. FSL R10-2771]|uniref:cohesin domain-containing protein n=1 Tax=Paenibacillus sp. FSL R10-2771 TaxID=2954693 RepID=UPI0030FA1C23